MSVNVQYYGVCDVSINLWGDSDGEKAQIQAFPKKDGIVFYTSHIMACVEEDAINAQMVAEAALGNWDEHEMSGVGLGSYVNQELANSGFVGKDWIAD